MVIKVRHTESNYLHTIECISLKRNILPKYEVIVCMNCGKKPLNHFYNMKNTDIYLCRICYDKHENK